jgi:hypothetical protein
MLWVWFSCSPFVWCKDGCYVTGLHQGRASLMPSLAAISEIGLVTLQFTRIITWARSMFCSFVDVSACFNRFVSDDFKHLIHSYTLHCGKQFCPCLTANCRCISALFIPSNTKKCTVACCLSLVQACSGAVTFSPHSLCSVRTTTEPHSRHVIVWPWATAWSGISSVPNHTTKTFYYWTYFLNLLHR